MSFNENQYRRPFSKTPSGNNVLLSAIEKAAKKSSPKSFINFTPSVTSSKGEGRILELSDDEIEQYKQGGYVVEEYSEGGLVGDPPPRNTIYVDPNDPEGVARYEAANDSLRAYNFGIDQIRLAESMMKSDKEKLKGFGFTQKIQKTKGTPYIGLMPIESYDVKYTTKDGSKRVQMEDGSLSDTYQSFGWAKWKKPVQTVEYREVVKTKPYVPNLNTDLSAWLKTQGAPASYADRKKLYEQATGQTDYKGTAEQNMGLLNLVKERGLDYKIDNLEKVPSNTSDKTAFVKSLSKMPERSEESVKDAGGGPIGGQKYSAVEIQKIVENNVETNNKDINKVVKYSKPNPNDARFIKADDEYYYYAPIGISLTDENMESIYSKYGADPSYVSSHGLYRVAKNITLEDEPANKILKKQEPKGLTRQVPKTEWKQLPNGTWHPVTRAGNKASVQEYSKGGLVGDPPPKLFNFDPTPEYVGYQGRLPVAESTRVANTYKPTQQEIKATKEYDQKVGATAQAIRNKTGVSHKEAMQQAEQVLQANSRIQPEAKAYANTKQAQERDAYVFDEGMNARDYFRYPLQFLAGRTPTQDERIQDRIRITDPRTSNLDKFMGTVGQAATLAPEALINTGVGLAFAPSNLTKLGMVADAVSPIGNPLAGVNPLKSKQLQGSPNVASSIDDVGRGLTQTPQAPKPLTREDITDKVEELTKVLDKNKDYINSEYYINLRMKNTGETREKVLKEIEKYNKRAKDFTLEIEDAKSGALGYYNSKKNLINVSATRAKSFEDLLETFDHEVKHMFSPVGLSQKPYKNYPRVLKKPSFKETFNEAFVNINSTAPYYRGVREQQVRNLRFREAIQKDLGLPLNEELARKNFDKWLDNIEGETLVDKLNNSEALNTLKDDVKNMFFHVHKNPNKRREIINSPKFKDKLFETLKNSWALVPAAVATGAAASNEYSDGGLVGNPKDDIKARQQQLINQGFNIGKVDGIWGEKSQLAWDELHRPIVYLDDKNDPRLSEWDNYLKSKDNFYKRRNWSSATIPKVSSMDEFNKLRDVAWKKYGVDKKYTFDLGDKSYSIGDIGNFTIMRNIGLKAPEARYQYREPEKVIPIKESPKGLSKQAPKTTNEWNEQLQMYVPITRGGLNTVEDTGIDAGGRSLKDGGVVMELTDEEIEQYKAKGLVIKDY